ncbi:hypothetical protein V1511DRAFT_500942 [Dipodascopsis uninucleata]
MAFLSTTARAQAPALQRKVTVITRVSTRGAHDLAVTLTGKPKISYGPGGRSSRTGYTATVFGATGFLGRYIVSKLARNGTVVSVPFREEMTKRFLKVTGDLGVVNFVEFDARNIESLEESVKSSDIVFNCIGRDYPTKLFSYYDVNVEISRRIASACAKYGVDRLVQVSSYNASPESTSEYFRTKFEAEQVVKEIVPTATIVRPSPMIGAEDRLVRKMISWPYFSVNDDLKIRPVHVLDVASALVKIGYDDAFAGKTFELYGPEEVTTELLRRRCEFEALKKYSKYSVPKRAFAAATEFFNKIVWWPVGCADEVERQTIDQVIDRSALTFSDVGIVPEKLEDFVGQYVKHMRANLFQDVQPDSKAELRREREYIHITR